MQHANVKKAKIIFKIIGEIIKEKRLFQDKSQRLLSAEYEIHKSMLCRIEKGDTEPRLTSLLTICEAMGIKPSELFLEVEKRLPEGFSLIEQ